MHRTDAELLKAATSDPQAFRAFYDRYADWVHTWFRRHTGEDSSALDLTAETFAQAWLSLRRFQDLAEGSGAPWLFGIARNLLREYYKHDRIETAARRRLGLPLAFADCEDYDAVEERLRAGALAPALHEAVGGLPADQRLALELRVVDQLDYEEVAGRPGITQNAARPRGSRAPRSLFVEMRGAEG